jgi:hypothetical protein
MAVAAAFLAVPSAASAADVAVFGDNSIDNALTAAGHDVTLVTDAQLATSGFLKASTRSSTPATASDWARASRRGRPPT